MRAANRVPSVAVIAVAVLGCASVDGRLAEGRRLSAQGDWHHAIEAFEEVRRRTCAVGATDERCLEAIIGQAEAYLRLGDPQTAFWFLVEREVVLFHGRASDERIEALRREAQQMLGSRLAHRPGRATLRVTFESNTTESFTPQQVALTIDLFPIPLAGLNDAKTGPVKGLSATTPISAGEHEIEAFTRYASGGKRLPPGYFIMVRERKTIEVADGDAVEIDIRSSERSAWSSAGDAIDETIQVRGARAK